MRLTDTQYNYIMQIYREARQDRDELIRSRRTELRKNIPELSQLEDSFRSAGRKRGLHMNYKGLTAKFIDQEKHLLLEHGYPEDYLDPPYHCPDCHDTGYVGENHDEPCHCFKKYALDLIYKDEPVMRRILTDSFEDFDLSGYTSKKDSSGISSYECASKAFSQSRRFVETFDSDFKNLFFYGTPGSGKTFLSSCIASRLIKTDHTVIYLSAVRLFDVMADYSFNPRKNRDDYAYSSLFSADLLIIDDLGTEVTNTFTASALFSLLNERLLTEKSTIISTNLTLNEVSDRYSQRVFSRLAEKYNFYHLFGFDGRIENKLKDMKPAKD
ncbi:MAG: DNA replication protein DnaC [Lachnospiraceae bacterium]|uniref:DNA replication protein DnaC n=1 Tax=Candidatus Weimeria bifida TaxID=2599074 RepID=A0A6N7J1K7_9FIRM|nr:DNA replication protein DnaC [Candidatus Weimeria bifida]RRF96401.1 MAG: DNA replication protein DnaC [Lachnospiraceae bacterium]